MSGTLHGQMEAIDELRGGGTVLAQANSDLPVPEAQQVVHGDLRAADMIAPNGFEPAVVQGVVDGPFHHYHRHLRFCQQVQCFGTRQRLPAGRDEDSIHAVFVEPPQLPPLFRIRIVGDAQHQADARFLRGGFSAADDAREIVRRRRHDHPDGRQRPPPARTPGCGGLRRRPSRRLATHRDGAAVDPFQQALPGEHCEVPPHGHPRGAQFRREFAGIEGTVQGEFPQDELLTILGQHAGLRLSRSLVFSSFIMNQDRRLDPIS